MKKGLGDELEVPDEEGRPIKLRIAGLLTDSVFQSELIIGDAAFRKSFPQTEGFSYFLIDVKSGTDPKQVKHAFEESLGVYGMEVTPTADRVASYLAVQNTYLTTFQLLGGFGLLLGVLGLAVVLLRNVWERRSELALLRAMGYRLGVLNRLVFVENALLLLLGLGGGRACGIDRGRSTCGQRRVGPVGTTVDNARCGADGWLDGSGGRGDGVGANTHRAGIAPRIETSDSRRLAGTPTASPLNEKSTYSTSIATKPTASSDTRSSPCVPHRSNHRRKCARRCSGRASTCRKSCAIRCGVHLRRSGGVVSSVTFQPTFSSS